MGLNKIDYLSKILQKLMDLNGFLADTSLYHAPLSGLTESGVKTAKKILKRSEDFNLHHSCGASPSPSQLLMGRNLREQIDVTKSYFKAKLPDMKRIVNNKKEQKKHTSKVLF